MMGRPIVAPDIRAAAIVNLQPSAPLIMIYNIFVHRAGEITNDPVDYGDAAFVAKGNVS